MSPPPSLPWSPDGRWTRPKSAHWRSSIYTLILAAKQVVLKLDCLSAKIQLAILYGEQFGRDVCILSTNVFKYSESVHKSAVKGAFNKEKVLVGAFSEYCTGYYVSMWELQVSISRDGGHRSAALGHNGQVCATDSDVQYSDNTLISISIILAPRHI